MKSSGQPALVTSRGLSILVAGAVIIVALIKADKKDIPEIVRLLTSSDAWAVTGWGCKTLSVICLSSLRLHPSGVRRSRGERSEPSAAEPRRGGGAPRAKNWSRAGHTGFLLGCHETHPTQNQNDPPKQS